MSSLEAILERLAQACVVRDIMVRKDQLVCAPDAAVAERLLAEHADFDVIPIAREGRLVEYLERDSHGPSPIALADVVSDTTSVLDLVELLDERRHAFVLSRRDLVGYVHFSDLNNPLVKVPLFVLLEAAERHVMPLVSGQVTEEDLGKVLVPARVQDIRSRMQALRKGRAELDWVNLLSFREVLHFARRYEKVRLDEEQVRTVSDVRNRVVHPVKEPLITSHADVGKLREAKRICFALLGVGDPG